MKRERLQEFLDSDSTGATITKVVLASVALSGIFLVGAMAPNALQIMGRYRRAKRYAPKQLEKSLFNLKQRGFLQVVSNKQGGTFVRLTKKGERKLKSVDLDEIAIAKPKKWDGKWRVLLFDLPVRFRKAREALRCKVKDLGFHQLQKSVWIYPYPCVEELLFVTEFFGVTKYVEIFTVEELLHDGELERRFGLLKN